MFSSIIIHANKLKINGNVVTYNGAMIHDINTKEMLFHKPISFEKTYEQVRRFEEQGVKTIQLYHNDKLYVEKKSDETLAYEKTYGVTAIETRVKLSKQIYEKKWDATKILVIMPPEKTSLFLLESRKKFGDSLNFSTSKPYFLEIMEKGINKGTGLLKLAEIHDVDISRTLAFGDALNDIEMLKTAGMGFAVGNASKPVKDAIGNVCDTNENDGLAKIIDKLCLNSKC